MNRQFYLFLYHNPPTSSKKRLCGLLHFRSSRAPRTARLDFSNPFQEQRCVLHAVEQFQWYYWSSVHSLSKGTYLYDLNHILWPLWRMLSWYGLTVLIAMKDNGRSWTAIHNGEFRKRLRTSSIALSLFGWYSVKKRHHPGREVYLV